MCFYFRYSIIILISGDFCLARPVKRNGGVVLNNDQREDLEKKDSTPTEPNTKIQTPLTVKETPEPEEQESLFKSRRSEKKTHT